MTLPKATTLYDYKPPWLRLRLPAGQDYEQVIALLGRNEFNTVCQQAQCPNQWECFSLRIAAFLIMGPNCTRHCRFCAIEHGPLAPPDPAEPAQVAAAVRALGLRYVVVTSVTRDDLADGGASYFSMTVKAIRETKPDAIVEVLIPDFQGDAGAMETVVAARPDVLNHNVETVPRLYPAVRPEAGYGRSLELLRRAKKLAPWLTVKSGLMLGMGEFPEEVRRTCQDLLDAGCSLLTLGQYLQPSPHHFPVQRYVPPEEFEEWKRITCAMGFSRVASSPFVRSSYHAGDLYEALESHAHS